MKRMAWFMWVVVVIVALGWLSWPYLQRMRIEAAIAAKVDRGGFDSSGNTEETVRPLLLDGLRPPDTDLARRAARDLHRLARGNENDEQLASDRAAAQEMLSHADPEIRNLGALMLGEVWSSDLSKRSTPRRMRDADVIPLFERVARLDENCRLHFLAGFNDRTSLQISHVQDHVTIPSEQDFYNPYSPAALTALLRLEQAYSCDLLRGEAGRVDGCPEVRAYACLLLWRALDQESLPTFLSIIAEPRSPSKWRLRWIASEAVQNLCGASLARISEVLDQTPDLALRAQMLYHLVEVLGKRGDVPPPALLSLLGQLAARSHILLRPRAATAVLLLDQAAGEGPYLDALGDLLEESRSTNRVTKIPVVRVGRHGGLGGDRPLGDRDVTDLYAGLVGEMIRGVVREDRAPLRPEVVRVIQTVLRREDAQPLHPEVACQLVYSLLPAWGNPTLSCDAAPDLRAWFDLIWNLQGLTNLHEKCYVVSYFGTHVIDDDEFMARVVPYLDHESALVRLAVVVAFDNYANRKQQQWEDRLAKGSNWIEESRVDLAWLETAVERWRKWWEERPRR